MPTMTFVMLNPSTAGPDVDDPTIRRCLGFARREGCGELVVVNLFAWRATSPRDLRAAIERGEDAWGPEQAQTMTTALRQDSGPLVAAWGANPIADRAVPKLPDWLPWKCLGTTKSGAPRHPLYVRADEPLVDFDLERLVLSIENGGRRG